MEAGIYTAQATEGSHTPTNPLSPGVCGEGGLWGLLQQRRDQLGEAVACPVEPALHGAEVARGDLGDPLIALALELPQHEHHTAMLWHLHHAPIHPAFPEALAV